MNAQEAIDEEIAIFYAHIEELDELAVFKGWGMSLEEIADAVWCDMQATGEPLSSYNMTEITALFGK
jgi:hypothetical protein